MWVFLMTDEQQLQRFYKHTNEKREIESNLKQVREILGGVLFLTERAHVYARSGGRSGDLYSVDKTLWIFGGEASFMSASVGNDQQVHLYEVKANSTQGWSQYLSVILRGPFGEGIVKQFEDADFAPKHSYLAKNDFAAHPNFGERLLWIDDLVQFDNPLVR